MVNVELDTAVKIADKMVKPWKWTTAILSAIVACLLYVIINSNIKFDNNLLAEKITADKLNTITKLLEK